MGGIAHFLIFDEHAREQEFEQRAVGLCNISFERLGDGHGLSGSMEFAVSVQAGLERGKTLSILVNDDSERPDIDRSVVGSPPEHFGCCIQRCATARLQVIHALFRVAKVGF